MIRRPPRSTLFPSPPLFRSSPRLTRPRHGVSLLGLGILLVWLSSHGLDPLAVALHAGALGAVIGAAYAAAGESDRAALGVALTHPTTPLAIATGRYLAAVVPAAGLVIATTVAVRGEPPPGAAGVLAAAAPRGCGPAARPALRSAGGRPPFPPFAGGGAPAPAA